MQTNFIYAKKHDFNQMPHFRKVQEQLSQIMQTSLICFAKKHDFNQMPFFLKFQEQLSSGDMVILVIAPDCTMLFVCF